MKSKPRDYGRAAVLHEVALECQGAVVGMHHGAHGLIGHGHDARTYPQPPAEIIADAAQAFAGCQAAGAFHVNGEIRVTDPKPGFAAQRLQSPHERPCLFGTSPTGFRIRDACQSVENGVQIR